MVRTYKKKQAGVRENYANDPRMEQAYNAVMKKEMSAYAAAKHFGVGHKALWLRISGQIPINAHQGRSTDLTQSVEREIEECILQLADWGWGFTTDDVVVDVVVDVESDSDPAAL